MSVIASSPQIVRMPRGGMRADFTHPILNKCVGWWPLTDGAGGTLVDISGNGRDATLNGTNSWVADSLGTANRFDNSSSSGNNATTAQHQIDLSNYTVAFWVNNEDAGLTAQKYGAGVCLTDGVSGTTSSDVDVYFRSNSTTQWPQLFHNRNNGGTFDSYALSESNKASQRDVWKFWTITFDGTKARVYRDSSLVGTSSTLAAPISTTGKHIAINGVQTSTTGITCSMQNIRLYSRALSADEITLLYERPWSGLEALSPFAFYTTGAPTAGASRFLINGFRSLLINGGIVQ